ncbi:hypothetical protein SAMN05216526_0430 [Ectothiorhodosinus mongolicus]|uniref:PH domain-containing protein n=1 Tax=Ectothiorhodosinus mongolicus TaxID=233100 RepID=A0A1R3VS76_9GAMM|nr:hypothetical protein [Ectothiorhodosinus mongolicus]ULX56446.1 hypothetical protein CKX93_01215 [Ectothiorhodosinus mongolicus]SIT65992.1 hypothetical protein SAMN05216526_0430 [Ectothiorhodosinus mongolicus]
MNTLVLRHYDPLAIALQVMPVLGLVAYTVLFSRLYLDGQPPHWINLGVLLGLAIMLFFAVTRLSPYMEYRFERSPAKVRIERKRLIRGNPWIEHNLRQVERISIEQYPFNRGHRHVVCLHLADGRRIIDGMPDALASEPIYDFAVKVSRFYGITGKR